jgi:hypothetical protein
MARNFEGAKFAPCKCGYGLVSIEEFDDAHSFSRKISTWEQNVTACPKCCTWPEKPEWGNLGRVGEVLTQRFKNVSVERVFIQKGKIVVRMMAEGFTKLEEIEVE